LASLEFAFPPLVYLSDLTQATFTAGTPGTWTAPFTQFSLMTVYPFGSGTAGIAVAPGSSHLAVVTSEFGGSAFAVLKLPANSGTGVPNVLDYAVALIPPSAACGVFDVGKDPHTITAYTSPNNGNAYAVLANAPAPTCLPVVDLAAVLAAPRGGLGLGTNDVSAANLPAGAITFFAIP